MFRFRGKWLVVCLAIGVPLAFAAFTQHAWEDYFITLRSSRNLVEGHGLVFTPGERLHTFTSPLGVLLPALCKAIAGVDHEARALWLFRLFNISLLAATATLLWRRLESLQVGALGRFTAFGLLLADAKLADFATNGMETALVVFFLLWLWIELEAPAGPRMHVIALTCAGLMWTRPDGCVLGAAAILPQLVFRRRADGAKRIPWRALIVGVLLGGLLYLPWFAWAWWYYGSPIPHTVVAKSAFTAPFHVRDLLLIPWRTLTGHSLQGDLFLPTYWFYGGWPAGMPYFGRALAIVAAFAWLWPRLPDVARRLSFAVFLGMFYVCSIILFPWYAPPWMALTALAVGFTVDAAHRWAIAHARTSLATALRLACALAVVVQVALLGASAWEMRVQQRVIENSVRRSIGEWLHGHAGPHDTVLLEPLGYIGYYSGLKTYDVPGLSSNEVVAAIRSGISRYADLIVHLRPTWLVLRPSEIAENDFAERPVLRDYRLVKEWNVRPELDRIRYLPGRNWLEHDACFRVFRYEPPAPATEK